MMAHRIAALAALLAISSAAAAPLDADLTGHWKIVGTADAQQTTSLSSDDADQLVGEELIVAPSSLTFHGETCSNPSFKRSRRHTVPFFLREYKLDPKNLKLPDPVVEVSIVCDQASPINFIYLQGRRRIVFFWRGFFLNASKQADAAPAAAP